MSDEIMSPHKDCFYHNQDQDFLLQQAKKRKVDNRTSSFAAGGITLTARIIISLIMPPAVPLYIMIFKLAFYEVDYLHQCLIA